MMREEEKIIICFFIIFLLIGLGVGFLLGKNDTVNRFNDADKVHFEMAQKDYKYCPNCGIKLEESEDKECTKNI